MQVSLSIDARTVPLLPGVKDALAAGIKSTAYAANAQLAHSVSCSDGDATDRLLPALWDPQTSGALFRAAGRIRWEGLQCAQSHVRNTEWSANTVRRHSALSRDMHCQINRLAAWAVDYCAHALLEMRETIH